MWTNPDTRTALVAAATVARGTQNWTTAFTYRWGLGNYNDYGRPYQITRLIPTHSRITVRVDRTRTFQYGFTPYIIDRDRIRIRDRAVESYLDLDRDPSKAPGIYKSFDGLSDFAKSVWDP